jgi:photosystem II stability/assembly factor-like uncharacterized protein
MHRNLSRILTLAAALVSFSGLNAQWFNQVSAVPDNLYAVHFTGRDTGYAVGGGLENSRIMRTFNGGSTWQNISLTQSKWLYDVHFVNDSTGLACGHNGVIYKTTDYGNSWSARPSEVTDWLYAIDFLNTDTGYMAGVNGRIIKTVNGGNNWTQLNSGTSTWLLDIRFYDAMLGYACGQDGRIFRSTNGGNSWAELDNPINNTLNSLAIINPDTIFAVGNVGTIMRSTDSGETWAPVFSNTTANLKSVYFSTHHHGYIVGETIILETVNGGLDWFAVSNPVTVGLEDIFIVPDATTAYAVGKSGAIIKNDLTTGIDEESQTGLPVTVYPNPCTDGKIVVDLSALSSSVKNIRITSLSGEQVLMQQGNFSGMTTVDVSNLASGTYLLSFPYNGKQVVRILILP